MTQIDPGPGYRLVHHSEPPQEGIELWCRDVGEWMQRLNQTTPLCDQWTYRIAVNPSQRYRITGTGSKFDGQIVRVVEWFADRCLVRFSDVGTWIERRCLEPITDHIPEAKKKVEPVVKQSLTTEYIEPTAEHVGQMVEISDGHLWYTGRLLGVLPDQYDSRYICQDEVESKEWNSWRHARIKPEPKPELRYRDVTPADIGKKIEVRQSEKYGWIEKTLTKIVHTTTYKNPGTTKETMWYCQHNSTWRQARIVEGGEA